MAASVRTRHGGSEAEPGLPVGAVVGCPGCVRALGDAEGLVPTLVTAATRSGTAWISSGTPNRKMAIIASRPKQPLATRGFSVFRRRDDGADRCRAPALVQLGVDPKLRLLLIRLPVLGAGAKLLQGPVACGKRPPSFWARSGTASSGWVRCLPNNQ